MLFRWMLAWISQTLVSHWSCPSKESQTLFSGTLPVSVGGVHFSCIKGIELHCKNENPPSSIKKNWNFKSVWRFFLFFFVRSQDNQSTDRYFDIDMRLFQRCAKWSQWFAHSFITERGCISSNKSSRGSGCKLHYKHAKVNKKRKISPNFQRERTGENELQSVSELGCHVNS